MTDTYSVSLSALWILDLDCCELCLPEKSNYSIEINKYGKISKGCWKFCSISVFSLLNGGKLKFLCSVTLVQSDVNYLLVLYMSVKSVWFILEKNVPDEIPFFSFGDFFMRKKTNKVNIGQ